MRTAVAIYARTSQDRTGEGLGGAEVAGLASRGRALGWLVAEEHIDDDDISAYSGKVIARCSTNFATVSATRSSCGTSTG